MARIVHVFDDPDRFVVGTVGLPGDRTFFIQARDGIRLLSVALEKEQVQLLAERLDDLLDQVENAEGIDSSYSGPADLEPLDHPIDEEFRVGTLAIGWNSTTSRVIIEAHEVMQTLDDVPDLESDSLEGPDVIRVRINANYARSFCVRAMSIVTAGRPPCPLCDQPLDARGHICPRANGFRRRG